MIPMQVLYQKNQKQILTADVKITQGRSSVAIIRALKLHLTLT